MTGEVGPFRHTMDGIAQKIAAADPPRGDEWNLQKVVTNRLYVSRNVTGQAMLFLEGDEPSFGNYSNLPGALHVRVTDIETGRAFTCLRVPAPREAQGGERAVTHIVYEMAELLHETPAISNQELLLRVQWVLGLLGAQSELLTTEAQLGLAGECLLLQSLLQVGLTNQVSPLTVIERWLDGSRDFAAKGISIEVKTTAGSTRLHHVGSIDQLEPSSPVEAIYLYSIGIKVDRLHSRRLPEYVDAVAALLVDQEMQRDELAYELLLDKLRTRGYHESHRPRYAVGPGLKVNIALPPRLYRVADLDILRKSSLVGEALPSMVRNVGYDLELPEGLELAHDHDVFKQLVTSPVIG